MPVSRAASRTHARGHAHAHTFLKVGTCECACFYVASFFNTQLVASGATGGRISWLGDTLPTTDGRMSWLGATLPTTDGRMSWLGATLPTTVQARRAIPRSNGTSLRLVWSGIPLPRPLNGSVAVTVNIDLLGAGQYHTYLLPCFLAAGD